LATIDTFITGKPSVEKLGTDVVPSEIEASFASTNVTSTDTAGLIRLPAGAVVSTVVARVKTAEGGVATADIGIRGGTSTQFFSNLDMNVAGESFSASPNYMNESGDEEIIEIAPDNDLDAAVLQVHVVYSISELTL
jgi:hypothetical protein